MPSIRVTAPRIPTLRITELNFPALTLFDTLLIKLSRRGYTLTHEFVYRSYPHILVHPPCIPRPLALRSCSLSIFDDNRGRRLLARSWPPQDIQVCVWIHYTSMYIYTYTYP